mmetsp:Transcript_29019/g.83235  ORF Transcript_29019/g.83235 Transcript_29019/m.83235 type:complete len:402 (-) Transcript_29019:148-1353(-)
MLRQALRLYGGARREGVLQGLLHWEAARLVHDEQTVDELLGAGGRVLPSKPSLLEVPSANSRNGVLVAGLPRQLEWVRACDEDVEDDTQRPHIGRDRCAQAGVDLGRGVGQGAGLVHDPRPLFCEHNARAEVAELQQIGMLLARLAYKQEVLRLQVTMDHMQAVQVGDGEEHLPEEAPRDGLVEAALCLSRAIRDVGEQVPAGAVLQDDARTTALGEVLVHLHQVRMLESVERHALRLERRAPLGILLLVACCPKDLNRTSPSAGALGTLEDRRLIDVPESALPQQLSQGVVVGEAIARLRNVAALELRRDVEVHRGGCGRGSDGHRGEGTGRGSADRGTEAERQRIILRHDLEVHGVGGRRLTRRLQALRTEVGILDAARLRDGIVGRLYRALCVRGDDA